MSECYEVITYLVKLQIIRLALIVIKRNTNHTLQKLTLPNYHAFTDNM